MSIPKLELSLFKDKELARNYACSHCQTIGSGNISIREVVCSKPHLLCTDCIATSNATPNHSKKADTLKTCPIHNENNISIVVSRWIERQIASLIVRCPNAKSSHHNQSDCDWEGAVRGLANHLKSNCQFTKIKCEYCSNVKLKKFYRIHLETCGFKPVSCTNHCSNKKILRMHLEKHFKRDCLNSMIDCPNKDHGCKTNGKRSVVMNQHIKNECLWRRVDCPFVRYGCNVINIPFRQLSEHLSEYETKHLSLELLALREHLINIQQTMDERLNEQSQKIDFLQKSLRFDRSLRRSPQPSLDNPHHGLLVFCGTPATTMHNGSSSNGTTTAELNNSVELVNLTNRTKHTLLDSNRLQSITHPSENHVDTWNISSAALSSAHYLPFAHIQPYLMQSKRVRRSINIIEDYQSMPTHNASQSLSISPFWNNETVTTVFRVGGFAVANNEALTRVDGCVLETNDWFVLPTMKSPRIDCASVYGNEFGLVTLGGTDIDDNELSTVEYFSFNPISQKFGTTTPGGDSEEKSDEYESNSTVSQWRSLPSMTHSRVAPGLCLWDDMSTSNAVTANDDNANISSLLFVAGGISNDIATTGCEIFDFNQNQWYEIGSMNVGRSYSTLIHWRFGNKCINIGGLSSAASQSGEIYDMTKDVWTTLPQLNHKHRRYPCVWIDNSSLYNNYSGGILCVAGDHYEMMSALRDNITPQSKPSLKSRKIDLGAIELLDLRDSKQKWMVVGSVNNYFPAMDFRKILPQRMVCC